MNSPALIQDNQLLNEFFEAYQKYKVYTSLSGLDLRKEMMKIAFLEGVHIHEWKIQFGYVKHSNSFIRLYQILDKLEIDGNISVTEQIERFIYNSFDNKFFLHDPQ